MYRVIATAALTLSMSGALAEGQDPRELVELLEMMQWHMMSNMRDHLAAIDEIL